MMKKDVALADLLIESGDFGGEAESARDKGRELQVGAIRLIGEREEAGEIDGAGSFENLPGAELELLGKRIDDCGGGVGFDFEANDVAFAAIVELGVDGLEQVAGFFFVQIEVAVAGGAEGAGADDLESFIEVSGVCLDEVMKEDVVDVARFVFGGNADEARESARNGDDTEIVRGGTTARAQREGDAERFVDDVRERMRRVDGDGGEEWIDLAGVEEVHRVFGGAIEQGDGEDANAFLGEGGDAGRGSSNRIDRRRRHGVRRRGGGVGLRG